MDSANLMIARSPPSTNNPGRAPGRRDGEAVRPPLFALKRGRQMGSTCEYSLLCSVTLWHSVDGA
jgi:hypothetical protein